MGFAFNHASWLRFALSLIAVAYASVGRSEGDRNVPGRIEVSAIDALPATGRLKNLGKKWTALKEGQIEFAAMLLEMYPDHEFFFLERDARQLGQTAWLIANADEKSRVHFLNVNRETKSDPLLREYLTQEGLTEALLASGKKILFIDTGFLGSIPKHIRSLFPKQYQSQLQTHMLLAYSEDAKAPEIPSSHGFAAAADPDYLANGIRGKPVFDLAGLPKSHGRADRYVRHEGRIVPYVSVYTSSRDLDDGTINPRKELPYLEDLKASIEHSVTALTIKRKRAQWRKANQLHEQGNLEALNQFLRSLLETRTAENEAFVRDFISITRTNRLSEKYLLSAAAFGRKQDNEPVSPAAALRFRYPEVARFFQDDPAAVERALNQISPKEVTQLIALAERETEIRTEPWLGNLYEALSMRVAKPSVQEGFLAAASELSENELAPIARYAFRGPVHAQTLPLARIILKRISGKDLPLLVANYLANENVPSDEAFDVQLLNRALQLKSHEAVAEFAALALKKTSYRDRDDWVQRLLKYARNTRQKVVYLGLLEGTRGKPSTEVKRQAQIEALTWSMRYADPDNYDYVAEVAREVLSSQDAESLPNDFVARVSRWARKNGYLTLKNIASERLPSFAQCVFRLLGLTE